MTSDLKKTKDSLLTEDKNKLVDHCSLLVVVNPKHFSQVISVVVHVRSSITMIDGIKTQNDKVTKHYCVKSIGILSKRPHEMRKKDPFSHTIQIVHTYPTCKTMTLPGKQVYMLVMSFPY